MTIISGKGLKDISFQFVRSVGIISRKLSLCVDLPYTFTLIWTLSYTNQSMSKKIVQYQTRYRWKVGYRVWWKHNLLDLPFELLAMPSPPPSEILIISPDHLHYVRRVISTAFELGLQLGAYYMKASYPAKRIEKRIRSKACTHQLSLYAVFNSLSQ